MAVPKFSVIGNDNGFEEILHSCESFIEAKLWVRGYTSRLDDDGRAGGWPMIEIYEASEGKAVCVYLWEAE